jgi:hypothetical protein
MDLVDQQFAVLLRGFQGANLERRSDGTCVVKLPNLPLPRGWNRGSATAWFVVPVGFPVAQPDTFWTDADLRLEHGGFPANTNVNTNHGGPDPRLWFSFHPTRWDPNRDTLTTFARLIEHRLQDPK